jgi:hypothetical protein
MAIGANQEMPWVIWIEIHYYIGMGSAMDNKPLFITQLWNFAERTSDLVSS